MPSDSKIEPQKGLVLSNAFAFYLSRLYLSYNVPLSFVEPLVIDYAS